MAPLGELTVPEAMVAAVALPRPKPNVCWVQRFRSEGLEGEEEAEVGPRQESRQRRVMEAAPAAARR